MGDAGADQSCQIYLAAPAWLDTGVLARVMDRDLVAALLLYSANGTTEAVAREAVGIAHAQRVPVLLADAPELARAVGADGVHIPANEEGYRHSRSLLGAEATIGAGCGTSRHDALVLGELGADYVAFGPEPGGHAREEVTGLVSWWQEVCEPAVVGWHCGGWDEAAALIEAGADFIAVSSLIWDAADAEAALHDLYRMITDHSAA